ncbi:hypothetical protein CELL_02939 [Cellulomonas sp. T2.31MG-18]|uniref:hypothetical protein n=1 Tax=Cellulomonas sp. T2.31MG-18 TaxID=3157619 RepID=UPI0035F06F39
MAINGETERADRLEPVTGTLLDARSAAARVGVSVDTLRAATATGQVAHVRLRARGTGKRDAVRWLPQDLDAWIGSHRIPASRSAVAPRSSGHTVELPAPVPHGSRSRGRAAPLLSARAVLRATGKRSDHG